MKHKAIVQNNAFFNRGAKLSESTGSDLRLGTVQILHFSVTFLTFISRPHVQIKRHWV